jgi:hypothetical protein
VKNDRSNSRFLLGLHFFSEHFFGKKNSEKVGVKGLKNEQKGNLHVIFTHFGAKNSFRTYICRGLPHPMFC